jgi:hypothetical protein
MPGWLTWTLVAVAAWLAASIVAAFALGRLFRPLRQAEPTVNDLPQLELEYWATSSLTRAAPEDDAPAPQRGTSGTVLKYRRRLRPHR